MPVLGPYSGGSTLCLVARASAFSVGVVYGSLKLKYLTMTKKTPIGAKGGHPK
ncbi:unnamed protein product [Linum tenue]|uniref:ATP synthase subunit e, mitochondrial n=1 Tax=Linum tenue TaxID=586396 RepID=A0AAV0LN11_9ROSI|nr:unnamed protein product [Linum tenue]